MNMQMKVHLGLQSKNGTLIQRMVIEIFIGKMETMK